MRTVLCALFVIGGVHSAAAQEQSLADKVFQGMPCQAWTIIQHDNWAGNADLQTSLEAWTIENMRAYAKSAAAQLPKDGRKYADDSDVSDQQIINWLSAYCRKHPESPLIKAEFFLWMAISLVADHHNIPLP